MIHQKSLGQRLWLGRNRLIIQFILIVGSVFMAYPLAFGAAASLSTLQDYAQSTWFPRPVRSISTITWRFSPPNRASSSG